ncbi:30S ribosomal protein S9 [Candidatus Tremblaya phenacola]|uniref:30S ribosomal protein S9 n=1 Tax=Candidatus Tremblayella phenacoccinincola TaxID=1010676 RepID=UPI0013300A05|nr:30S ribosomal protein S9 [Candidatus Tremblaya phenacola]KAH0998350.1 SSU ribosomal protein S9p [Candidatus Tremblaya phenacola]
MGICSWFYGTGRRKRSTARVFIRENIKNEMLVNGIRLNDYFTRHKHIEMLRQVIQQLPTKRSFLLKATVKGGGKSGQADSIRLGLSRALVSFSPAFKQTLAKQGYLTRDSREVERKKCGLHKARKQKQFSKR